MKILHSADWHLDASLGGDGYLKSQLLLVPGKIAQICREQQCDLVLLAGDLFDGRPTQGGIEACKKVFREMGVPIFISPGNHDFVTPDSLWLTENWPENVHIFTKNIVESVVLPDLDCKVYGASFTSMDCGSLLSGFRAEGEEKYQIGIFHGDPVQKNSPYNPISQAQVGTSGLAYLALGHVHKAGSLRAKGTLCAWPGCPMGRGFDELEEKGLWIVTLEEQADARFMMLDTPRFYDMTAPILTDAKAAVEAALPAAESRDYYRIRLTGEAELVDISKLLAAFPQFPNLEILDETVPVTDLWRSAGDDSLEGEFFRLLREKMQAAPENQQETYLLAARFARMILDGREVDVK